MLDLESRIYFTICEIEYSDAYDKHPIYFNMAINMLKSILNSPKDLERIKKYDLNERERSILETVYNYIELEG